MDWHRRPYKLSAMAAHFVLRGYNFFSNVKPRARAGQGRRAQIVDRLVTLKASRPTETCAATKPRVLPSALALPRKEVKVLTALLALILKAFNLRAARPRLKSVSGDAATTVLITDHVRFRALVPFLLPRPRGFTGQGAEPRGVLPVVPHLKGLAAYFANLFDHATRLTRHDCADKMA